MAFITRLELHDEKFCQSYGEVLTLSGLTRISSIGKLQYTTNQSGSYIARSVPDVEYVTGLTNNLSSRLTCIENNYVTGGTNGLSKTGKNLKLGGPLTESTTITGSYFINFCNGAKLNTQLGYSISGSTMLRNSQRTLTSVFVGYNTCSNGTGVHNVGFGACVLSGNTIGFNNVGIGGKALTNNTGGYDNIGIGFSSMCSETDAINNIGIGAYSLSKLTSGSGNIAMGCNSMYCCAVVGCENIGIGSNVMKSLNSGCFNIGIGSSGMQSIHTGYNNIGIGHEVLNTLSNGCDNIAIGNCSGYNTDGCNNVYIGKYAGNNGTGSNKFYLSNSASCNLIFGDFTGNTVTLPALKLCTTPVNGASNDYILVWNNADKSVKKILSSAILAGGVTGATNGVTQVGQKVKLGGALTGDTNIALTQKNLSFTGSYLTECYMDKSPANNGGFISKYSASSGGTDVVSEIINGFDNTTISVRNPNTPFECQAIDLSLLNGMRVIDTANCKGLVYDNDYSNNFTNESLVTKRFVTGQTTTAGIQYAGNGLTKLGSTVVLGGELTGDTTIYGCNRNFGLGCFNNYLSGFRIYANDVCQYGLDEYTICSVNQINLMSDDDITLKGGSVSVCALANYNTDYSNSYTARSLVDKAFVTGLTNNINLDITYLSGVTDNIIQDIIYVSGVTSGNTVEINSIHQDITGLNHTLSGHTGNTTIHHTPEEIKTIIGIDTVSGSSSIFLNKKGDFINIPVVGNGSSSNVYFTTLDSEETGYKLLSYTLEPTETTLSATFSNTTHLVQKYLYPQGVTTTLLPAGTYDFNFYVSSNKAGSSIIIEFFKRSVGDVDTVLFSGASTQEITSTINRISIILSEIGYPVDPTDRVGINVYFKSGKNNTTMNLIIGDGRGAYWKGTAMPRHSDIRDKNGEQSFQHIDNNITVSGITTNDKFTIYSSNLGKYVSVDRNIYLSWLSNLYVPVVNGSTDNAIARFDGITGKLIQNSGVIIDDSNYMGFGVTPTAQITQTSTAALESAPLGDELLTSSNWTTTDWTGDFINGFTHTTGNVTPLTNTLAAVNNTLYQIAFTVTNRTAGSFTIIFGNQTSGTYTSSNAWGVKTTGTGTLSITPTSDFNGTIVMSIKRITGTYAPTYQILDSTGISTLEIRSSLNTLNNTFIGKGAGSYNTTGYNNSAQGVFALQNNTTGNQNSAQGGYALQYNTTGNQNSAQGVYALYSNTTGYQNSAQGVAALYSNTTGYNNSAQGGYALRNNTTGNYNSAQGVAALDSNTTGSNNSAQGYAALYSNTTGSNNSAQGVSALQNNTTGSNNSAQGGNAGRYLADGVTANQTSNNSVFLGSNTKSKQASQTNEIVIGANAIGNGSNTATIGHTDVTDTYLRGNIHLETTPLSGAGTDSILVYNTSDCYVKSISTSDVLSSAILTANNGLTKSGQNVRLGGVLTGNTGISGAYTMGFNNTYLNLTGTSGVYISGPTKLLSTPSSGAGTDSVLVWNSTDKTIKSITCACINSGNITTANNGLTKSGQNVRLGGPLTGATTINGGGYALSLGSLNNCLGLFVVCSSSLQANPTGNGEIIPTGTLTLGGSSVTLNKFATYNNNYSSLFTKYSLVDKNYVTGLTSTLGIQTANNGLTKSGLNVRLGGSLTGNTSITGAYVMGFNNNVLNLTGSTCVNISGPTKLLSTPSSGAGTDSVLVWNSTDKTIKSITCACINAGNIIAANNGLNKSGQTVKLGGTLSESTTICGNNNDLSLGKTGSVINNFNILSTNTSINSSENINFSGNTINLNGSFINSCNVINYTSDFSSLYTNRSLVDKAYVDSVATGLEIKASVLVATTAEITLSGLQTIDGVTLTAGNRVLVKNQTIQWRNGIYDASSGAWVRSSDYDFSILYEISNGDLISVLSGNTNANSIWALTSLNPIISGTTNLVFTKFMQQTGVIQGNGISIANSGINKEISVKLDTNSGLIFNGTVLTNDWNNYRVGLCVNNYKVDLRVNKCTATGSEIPVSINTGGTNTLYVDSSCINSVLGSPITTANNGLTKSGQNVRLGGTLTGNTVIVGASKDFTIGCNSNLINNYNVCSVTNTQCATGNINIFSGGVLSLKGTSVCVCALSNYNSDYSGSYTARSLVDKGYVTGLTNTINSCLNTINSLYLTGATNGLSLSAKKIKLGGTLTEATTINGGGYALNLGLLNNCLGAFTVCSSSSSIIPTGTLTLGGSSITLNQFASYNSNYSSSFTKYSLVDKNYVTGVTSSLGVQTANNGLTKSGLNVRLGGSLTGNTGVNGAYTMGFNNTILNLTGSTCVNISGPTKLLSTPSSGVGADNILVWNSTDKSIKSITCACINAGNITTANNGLNKVGQNVRLGGSLTGDTGVNGAYSMGFNNSYLNLTGSTCVNISGPTKLLSTPSTGTNIDDFLVWNSTDKCVKSINVPGGIVNTITGLTSQISNKFTFSGDTFGNKKTIGSIDNQDFGIITNNTERITVLKDGSVGIGTTNPVDKLDVDGIIGSGRVLGNGEIRSYQTVGGNFFVSLKTDMFTVHRSGIYRNNAGFFNFYDTSTGDVGLDAQYHGANLVFQIGSVEKMRVSNSGNVGINKTNPSYKLDVCGTTATDYLKLLSTPSTGINADDFLVWSSTDKSVKKINVSGGIVNTVTGHTQQISNIKNIMVTGATSSTDNAIARFDGITGKLIQNSGVVIDDSNYMGFGITPTAQITQTSTAALESAPLGDELLTSSNWTTTDWTGDFATGFTHTTGNVTPLTNTLAALNNTLYQIAFTVTNRTAGSFTITFGNETSVTYAASNAWGVKTTGTGTLSITPTTDFNGTIVISIKRITGTYNPTYQILDSTGISTIEIRSSLNTLNNTFIGKGAGGYNKTGYNNTAQGAGALFSNTTGYQNSAQGVNALYSNTTGSNNSAQGVSALYSNTTGSYNSAQGVNALYSNTTGYQNSAQGIAALRNNTTGNNNSAQGVNALYYNTTGSNNSAQGFYVLLNNTTGYNNSAQGYSALYYNTTGYNNSAQGRDAGSYLADSVTGNQTSNNSVFLGYNTKSKQAGQTNEIVIGANAIGNGSNTVTLGHTTVTDTYLRGNIALTTPPLSGNTSDGVLVWNSTDKKVKLVSNSVITGGTISNANNGLTKSGSNVRLGGVLTGNTSITGAYAMGFSNSYLNLTGSTCVNISGPTKLLTTPSSGVGTDSILVWNSTDKTVKSITCACINADNITTANNGLTKSGQNVRLGGTLTGNTTINTSTSSFNIYGNGLYDTCTCVVNSCAGNGGSVYTQICQTNSLLYLNHCNVSQSKYSNISLCNGEIKQVSSLNNCITASNCISGAVVNTGTTGYDITPIYSKLYFGATAYQAVCNDGTSDIYGLNGVNITTPSSNGIILTGTLKLDTVPTTGTNTDSVLVYNSADKRVKSLGFGEFGDKNNIYSMSVIDSATGLTNSSPYVILVNHTLAVTMTLPASPTNGMVFKIKDASSVGAYDYNITIARNGKLIDRQTKDALINTDGGSIELVYNSTLGSWFTLSFIN